MFKVTAVYCGGSCTKYFASEKEAFTTVKRDFGPIYYDRKEKIHYAIVDGIELLLYPEEVSA